MDMTYEDIAVLHNMLAKQSVEIVQLRRQQQELQLELTGARHENDALRGSLAQYTNGAEPQAAHVAED